MYNNKFDLVDQKPNVFVASINGRKQLIHKDEISFVEIIGRKVELHLNGREVEMYSRMADMNDELGSRFFQIHRSFIINLDKVVSYERCEVTLSDGERVPMSRHKYREFVNTYLNLYG